MRLPTEMAEPKEIMCPESRQSRKGMNNCRSWKDFFVLQNLIEWEREKQVSNLHSVFLVALTLEVLIPSSGGNSFLFSAGS